MNAGKHKRCYAKQLWSSFGLTSTRTQKPIDIDKNLPFCEPTRGHGDYSFRTTLGPSPSGSRLFSRGSDEMVSDDFMRLLVLQN